MNEKLRFYPLYKYLYFYMIYIIPFTTHGAEGDTSHALHIPCSREAPP